MRIRPGIEVAGRTDVGCQRDNNEDSYSYWEPEREEDFQRKGRLAVVADGMGGYEGGQEASRLAVDTIRDVYGNALNGDPQAALLEGFETAHDRIRQYAEVHPALHGMGTTCTAVVVTGGNLYYAHVGDSRLYLMRGTAVLRLTRDHSYVSRLIETGVLTADEAEAHPQRHILTAALGAGSELITDHPATPLALQAGDILVLCTDGLWGLVSETELHDVVTRKSPQEACRDLVAMAKERGGPDNITLQILRVPAQANG